ncbi:efflux RND transporter periplasmic adaptor subunit [Crenobacter intestini]|uniref:Efflux RND transporter periplasmic adaptor subunit n=1 Tax=Crenobacter intestini TaxID=2563443 RepID=A0A4V4N8J4_9NEIS|nr:efflux RND transporter periplasmic adaptor subunit [Crenobacter intestini]TIC84673.1 efflux RND transporter periplasmic adaptor subunit [Crenobacter intestini]
MNTHGKWLLLTALAASLSACGGKEGGAGQQAMQAMPVSVVAIQPHDVPMTFEYAGQAAGFREVQVRSRVEGILLHRNFVEGRRVKQGETLFEIEPATYVAAVDQAKATLAVREADFNQAKRTYDRVLPLFKENAVSQQDRDNALGAYEAAKAAVEAARAQLKQAQINLGYTKVSAPISGLTSLDIVSEGSLVSPNSMLTRISQLDPVYVNFSFSDNEAQKLRKDIDAGRIRIPANNGYQVEVKMADGSMFSQVGKINFSDNVVNPDTGTISNRAQFANPQAMLLPGQFVRVILKGAERVNAITVPQVAVLTTQQGKMVWTVNKDGKAEPRPVEVIDTLDKDFVIGAGLAAGDRVVVDNILKLRPGVPLAPKVAAAKPSASQPAAQG